ncbi:bifunctional diaminohydroxyphosphoribosylaminopyrimidine deaminase/5-amino-6-(5-phosphoribosylamino)uracil reductase RibD [Bogoriella caseilytica]|uniref:Riboflavin biosynthesis protein RibD n=1 Tax=Bogoriella caseilytica TaxID=56055 RepID=A0A3N2BF51_9MICO|nr:bifunctional diaminohydroxyphosphoribosylaminopyrimidine deaminase/5-amino-6-(5-phosphoribosylamino)uracil reductase RibD [Bogoriella caseilytica]ROR73664.1 diaminohydroxyphosphoribosylaminopyrimidine deaminase/5-amino-6-(5-phosphoribosylamino)uracil reductase [Bogoriella caseilytica]
MSDDAIARALERATLLAARGPQRGGNPRVGCVLLDDTGQEIGAGWHRGAGTAHAEAAALAASDPARVAGSTAVITLEPCHHTGRTPPCSRALLAAGVRRVIYAAGDPDPRAAGGRAWLAAQGVDVSTAREAGVVPEIVGLAAELTRSWSAAVRRRRPWVLGKTATSLDGRVAAADGTSMWITGAAARAHGHTVRADVDAIVVGTGTLLADDPALTARGADGTPVVDQPLRVVLGRRAVPEAAAVRQGPGPWLHLATQDIAAALDHLWERGARRVLIEGGPTVLGAALRAGLVDELHSYLAPVLLGAGQPAVPDLGIGTLRDGLRWQRTETYHLGEDILITARRLEGAH